jgi:hypothetical protein
MLCFLKYFRRKSHSFVHFWHWIGPCFSFNWPVFTLNSPFLSLNWSVFSIELVNVYNKWVHWIGQYLQ